MSEGSEKPREAASSDDDAARRREIEERGWAAIAQIRELNAHLDPEVVLAEVTAEVEAYRQEEYERREREKAHRP